MKFFFQKIILASLVLSFTACGNEAEQASGQSADSSASKITTVEVVLPQARLFDARLSLTGTAMPNQQVMLHAQESGYVRSMLKDIGSKVQKGAVIARLSNPLVAQALSDAESANEQAKSQLRVAEAMLEAAKATERAQKATFGRLNGIYRKTPQLTTLEEVEQAQAQSEAATAAVLAAAAKQNAAIAGQKAAAARLAVAQERRAMLSVKAPFNGIITQRFVDNGATVQSGIQSPSANPLVEIQDINPIRLQIPLPESEAAALRPGMSASVLFPALSGPARQVKVSRVSGSLDPASKTMLVELDIPNSNGQIKPGMYAKIDLDLRKPQEVLSLPLTAQEIYKDAFYVLVVKDKIVERVPLRKGLTGKDFFEILNAEITKESQVIVRGKSLVKPGQTVEPVLKNE